MINKNIAFGIVGVGYWGPNFARALSNIDGVELKWCCDIDQNAIDKFSKLYPQVKTTKSINDLVNDKDLNAVIVVTPAQNHYQVTKKLLLSNKDVFVEKPLTIDPRQSQELIDIAKQKKKILMVDHIFLFNSAVLKIKEMLRKGDLGQIYYLYGLYNALGPIRKDVSALWDLPHFIYVATYLVGKNPRYISAFGKSILQPKMEDVVFVNLEFPDGELFHLHCSWIDPVKIRSMVVVGSKKMVVFDDMSREEKIKIYDRGADIQKDPNFAKLDIVLRDGDIYIPKISIKEPLKEALLTFIDSFRKRKAITSDGKEGLELVKILDIAQKSIRHQGKRYRFN